ncbi:hypothetical protein SUGI_0996460 [Cryptomeria japonica]|nr:hypothetical protein SUGI_0996460 [Cryptomeria japonica]
MSAYGLFPLSDRDGKDYPLRRTACSKGCGNSVKSLKIEQNDGNGKRSNGYKGAKGFGLFGAESGKMSILPFEAKPTICLDGDTGHEVAS